MNQPQFNDEDRDMTPQHELPPEEQSQALAITAERQLQVDTSTAREITPAEARNSSVAAVLDLAYRNASNLKLTPEESQALAADFPDDAFRLGAGGDDNLLYLEHAYLRRRLNDVLGIGAATPIRRREWAEEFTYFKDRQEKKGVRVYVDLILLVRGCVVGEAIGDAVYYPDNAKQNYSDALESAKSNAFRRCCKEFGVGLQPWTKGYCEGWKQRNRNGSQSARREYPLRNDPPPRQNAPQGQPRPAATPSDVLPKVATESRKADVVKYLNGQFINGELSIYFNNPAWPDGWELKDVPTTNADLSALIKRINERFSPPPEPENQHTESQHGVDSGSIEEMPSDIANQIITLPRKGSKRAEYMTNPDTIGGLYRAAKDGDQEARKRLFGVASNWTPESWVDNTGKKRPPNADDVECRIALDQFLEWERNKNSSGQ